MSIWRRFTNLLRGSRLNREIDEELEGHIAEAIGNGRDPEEAQRAFGSRLRHREASRDVRVGAWLDSLRSDAIFGRRQLRRNKITSAAAILSLALAMGLSVAAFRLMDAFLWRPLPVAHADRLFAVVRQGFGPTGDFRISDSNEYPLFVRERAAVSTAAELIAVSYGDSTFPAGCSTLSVNAPRLAGCSAKTTIASATPHLTPLCPTNTGRAVSVAIRK